jgi:hypothetical protein
VSRIPLRALLVVALISLVSVGMLLADSGKNHQVRNQHFGVSGGNVNNHSNAFCCSGTLGALLATGSTQYILSNNHILADTDQALPGEDISQPGLVDTSCQPATIVADFTAAPKLGTANVDAAIAGLRSGQMDSTGFIEDIGVPNSQNATASTNLGVAKSGRTTGLTCGTVQSVNTTVNVQYQQGCNKGKKFVITYTNQVVVGGSGFSAGGDSGSLIVTQGNASPTALLYAGSSTTTIGNPVQDVVNALSDIGYTVSFVASARNTAVACPSGGGGPRGPSLPASAPNQGEIDRATAVKERYAARLMADPAVMGAGVGADENDPALATIVIYVEEGRSHSPLPAELDGVRTQIVRTDRIRAYGWNEPQGTAAPSCSITRR